VPWAGVARHVAVLAAPPAGIEGAVLAVVTGREASRAVNLAGEPRGSLVLDGVGVPGALLTPAQVAGVRARYALARAVQISAALEQVLAWTVQYAGERVQFGRPLGKFQAVQMELAQMAGEVTATAALVDAAVQALGRGEPTLGLAAAAAKVRAGEAAETVAKLAHQVHGAIGFTQEHRLHHLTRRCWSWRDEAGSELVWSRALGAGLLAGGGDDLWPALTRVV
jgi:acyl-CoA dehydrogenase